MESRLVRCPFCGRTHVLRPWLNLVCPCGAKYYIHNKEWWERHGAHRIIGESNES